MKKLLASSVLAIVAASSVSAQSEVELSYGVDFVTNYLSKGLTNTDDKAAVQPYLDIALNGFYLFFWGSNASFGGVTDIELDVGVGYYGEVGDFGFDIGAAQYLYRDDKTDYGEAWLKLDYASSDRFSIHGEYLREFYADENWYYVSAAYGGLPYNMTLSGGTGSDFGSRNAGKDVVSADFGASFDLNDFSAFDIRAHYSSIEDERVVATMSFFR